MDTHVAEPQPQPRSPEPDHEAQNIHNLEQGWKQFPYVKKIKKELDSTMNSLPFLRDMLRNPPKDEAKEFIARAENDMRSRILVLDWPRKNCTPELTKYMIGTSSSEVGDGIEDPTGTILLKSLQNPLQNVELGEGVRFVLLDRLSPLALMILGTALDISPNFFEDYLNRDRGVSDFSYLPAIKRSELVLKWICPMSIMKTIYPHIVSSTFDTLLPREVIWLPLSFDPSPHVVCAYLDMRAAMVFKEPAQLQESARPKTVVLLLDTPFPERIDVGPPSKWWHQEVQEAARDREITSRITYLTEVMKEQHHDDEMPSALVNMLFIHLTGFVRDDSILALRWMERQVTQIDQRRLNVNALRHSIEDWEKRLSDTYAQTTMVKHAVLGAVSAQAVLTKSDFPPKFRSGAFQGLDRVECPQDSSGALQNLDHVKYPQNTKNTEWDYILTLVEDCQKHLSETYNSIRATLSIQESKRAIDEASAVTRLTEIAFLFIPLSFSTSLFGMEVKEFADISISTWAAVSAVLLGSLYLFRIVIGSRKYEIQKENYTQWVDKRWNTYWQRQHNRRPLDQDVADPSLAEKVLVPLTFTPVRWLVLIGVPVLLPVLLHVLPPSLSTQGTIALGVTCSIMAVWVLLVAPGEFLPDSWFDHRQYVFHSVNADKLLDIFSTVFLFIACFYFVVIVPLLWTNVVPGVTEDAKIIWTIGLTIFPGFAYIAIRLSARPWYWWW